MSKRNFTLLIIVLVIVSISVWGFLYFRNKTSTPGIEDPGGTNFLSQFNPFRNNNPKTPSGTDVVDISGNNNGTGETTKAKLEKVSSMPVAGFGIFMKERLKEIPIVPPPAEPPATPTKIIPMAPPTEFVPALRYVDRTTGNIYQTFADKIQERKFSVTVIPQVYEAYFGNRGESVIMRYLKADEATIQTFVGSLPKEYLGADTTNNNEIRGYFLPDNIKDISISPDTSKLLYLYSSGNSTVGTVLNFLDNKKSPVFDSAFSEWLSFWPNGGVITLSTKPSGGVLGYLYTINLSNGNSFTKSLGGIKGLTTLTSPDGNLVLYTDNTLTLSVYNRNSQATSWLGVRTLPDKCTWNKTNDFIYCAVPKFIDGSLYPDSWYQGEVSFSDQIWKIDATTGAFTLLVEPTVVAGGEEFDGIKLGLDEGENYLFFVNKKDSFLWKLDLK